MLKQKTQTKKKASKDESKKVVDGADNLENLEIQEDPSAVRFKLDNFDGPLDLLLHLIKEAKIDIKEIFISKITEQFLRYVEEIKDLPIEKVGEYLEMSATLLEIKSRKVLPVQEELPADEEDPETKLIRQLEEYKLFKEKSEELSKLEDIGKFYKAPDASVGNFRYELSDVSFDQLLDAFAGIMHKIEIKATLPEPKKIQKDRWTVAQKITQIKDLLLTEKRIVFSSLYSADYSKSEVINTFLAILELLKAQQICVEQQEVFGEIVLTKGKSNSSLPA